MIKIHTKDGKTKNLDLQDDVQSKQLKCLLLDISFQKQITGISITRKCGGSCKCQECHKRLKTVCPTCGVVDDYKCQTGSQHSMSRPVGFNNVHFLVDLVCDKDGQAIGERVVCVSGKNRAEMIIHYNQMAAKFSIKEQPGIQRFNPFIG